MKKLYVLLILLFVVSCTGQEIGALIDILDPESPNDMENPAKNPANQQKDQYLEGSVTFISNLIFPQAIAADNFSNRSKMRSDEIEAIASGIVNFDLNNLNPDSNLCRVSVCNSNYCAYLFEVDDKGSHHLICKAEIIKNKYRFRLKNKHQLENKILRVIAQDVKHRGSSRSSISMISAKETQLTPANIGSTIAVRSILDTVKKQKNKMKATKLKVEIQAINQAFTPEKITAILRKVPAEKSDEEMVLNLAVAPVNEIINLLDAIKTKKPIESINLSKNVVEISKGNKTAEITSKVSANISVKGYVALEYKIN